MVRKLFALLTNEGIPAEETILCEVCYKSYENRQYSREQASQSDDVDPEQEFEELAETFNVVECCICNYPY